MQHVRYTYSSGCSACESHDLKIWKPFSKNIFVINETKSATKNIFFEFFISEWLLPVNW